MLIFFYNLKIEIVVNWTTSFIIKPRKKITYLKFIQKPKPRNFKIISGSLAISKNMLLTASAEVYKTKWKQGRVKSLTVRQA